MLANAAHCSGNAAVLGPLPNREQPSTARSRHPSHPTAATRHHVEFLQQLLAKEGIEAAYVHGNMDQARHCYLFSLFPCNVHYLTSAASRQQSPLHVVVTGRTHCSLDPRRLRARSTSPSSGQPRCAALWSAAAAAGWLARSLAVAWSDGQADWLWLAWWMRRRLLRHMLPQWRRR